jgi:hypothetical protein
VASMGMAEELSRKQSEADHQHRRQDQQLEDLLEDLLEGYVS